MANSTIEPHCKIARLSFFTKLYTYKSSPVHFPSHFDATNRRSCQYHPLHMIIPYTATSATYQGSVLLQTTVLKIGMSYQYT